MRKFWIIVFLIIFHGTGHLMASEDFLKEQLNFERVSEAYSEKISEIESEFAAKDLSFPPNEIYLRAFKHDLELEVWIRDSIIDTFQHFNTYPICMSSGKMGPKRKQGDRQIPEGFYKIEIFNPWSNYHLSLGINYPNESDSIISPHEDPGGDIYIHGGCATIGCLPMTDDMIKEIYLLCVLSKNYGQEDIPVHIFPTRMDNLSMAQLYFGNDYLPELVSFWNNIKMAYTYFENEKRIPVIEVDSTSGKYVFYQDNDINGN